ncbi:NAD(P)H-binding protein [Actinomyces israelii]|uniref:NAD(P)H-binding protein n=1 Tax=Actinomyces israelii TaxID=1659 RepID=UPI0005B9371E|nr:NAD(P)H-binding protein [Actinomyces israelii]
MSPHQHDPSSTSSPLVAVTGATGRIGGAVAAQLRAGGLAPRLVVRNASRAPEWADDVAVARYGDRRAATAALTGVDILLMVSASESADRLTQHRTFIDAAAAAGVRHIVYTSFLSAAPDAVFTLARTHWATEEHLRASGMGLTVLRDSFYADFLPDLAVDGVIAGPAGTGRVGAVARAAAAVIRGLAAGDRRHDGAVYELTGPEALTLAEAAAVIARATGRPTVYREQTLEEAYASRSVYGAPDWEVDAWVSTYTAIASGALDRVTDDVERLTGRRPLSLAQLLADHR